MFNYKKYVKKLPASNMGKGITVCHRHLSVPLDPLPGLVCALIRVKQIWVEKTICV